MARRKSSGTRFKTSKEMDTYLDKTDLAYLFERHGHVESPKIRKINLDLPEWLISELDFEAERVGVSRQPLIKLWLAQKLEEERRSRGLNNTKLK
ncbi:MAG: hypothetical protein EA369_09100 [Bradymonadales bacterium]|nr:MAG: hypothetical protein EA369_09100 [Bradymonadales bacterium]